VRLLRHVGEEGERLVQVVATAHALAAERGEDGVVGDGVADVRERGEEGAGLRDGRPVEEAVEERRGVRAAPAEKHGEERCRGAGRLRGRGGRWGRQVGGRGGGGVQRPDETGLQALPHGGAAGRGAAAGRAAAAARSSGV